MAPDAPPSHIALVVDDDPDALRIVVTALENSGITALVARDGATARGIAGRLRPDVVLLDVTMPGPNGFETCQQLKAMPGLAATPIIFVTGLSEPEHIVRGLKCGAVDYLTKPLDLEELVARLTIHIMNSKLIRGALDAIDLSGPALLAFDETGHFAWGSPGAVDMLPDAAEAAAPGRDTGSELVSWARQAFSNPLSEVQPFGFRDRELRVVGVSASRELLVKVVSRLESDNEGRLRQAFGLTRREADVLVWLTRGKTNRDIALILNRSPRTINKHLDQIYQKMGVENRTSAAVAADRLLQAG